MNCKYKATQMSGFTLIIVLCTVNTKKTEIPISYFLMLCYQIVILAEPAGQPAGLVNSAQKPAEHPVP